MRLFLMRHGEAHAGFGGVISGRTGCIGLTDLGRQQAEVLRDHLASSGRIQADVLLASELPRAIETASIIAPGLGLETFCRECDLCEVHTGEADGLAWTEYARRYGPFDMEAEPDRVFAPQGESWNSFHRRVRGMLERVAREYEGRTVVAVCHAGVIMASMRMLLGVPDSANGAVLRPSNTGVTEWEHDAVLDRWTLHSFNESTHLLRLDVDTRMRTASSTLGYRSHMSDDEQYSVEAAREATKRGELRAWVTRFLASPGSDNAPLAEKLCERFERWVGPVQLPLGRIQRLAGPPEDPVLFPVDENYWDDRVDDMTDRIEGDAWDPAPVIVSYCNGQLLLEDGNHRVESLRRAGRQEAWAVVGFENEADCVAFDEIYG